MSGTNIFEPKDRLRRIQREEVNMPRIAGIVLLLTGVTGTAFADNWQKDWNVSDKPELQVDVMDGRIEMRPSNSNRIEARVTTVGWRIAPGEVTISEHQTGNRVDLELRVPHHAFHIDWGNHEIRVELRIPRNAASHVHTGDGSIHIWDLAGSFDVTSGDGSIEAVNIDGSLIARTGDGSVKVRGRLDALDVNTGDGSVEAELNSGSKLSNSWRVHTGDGHVTLRVPSDFRADLDAHTGDGDIHVDLPMTSTGRLHEKDVRGKINGGGELLIIRTGDGTIRLERA